MELDVAAARKEKKKVLLIMQQTGRAANYATNRTCPIRFALVQIDHADLPPSRRRAGPPPPSRFLHRAVVNGRASRRYLTIVLNP
jgi:hypothetical protein